MIPTKSFPTQLKVDIYEYFSEFMPYEFIYENCIEMIYEFIKHEFTYAFIYESATMNS
jgi:hypothetical protein